MNTINSTQRSTEGQCIELLMQLRRSLTQQYDVRLAVYEVRRKIRLSRERFSFCFEGLLPVLRKSPILMAPILDMLISQIARYYELIGDKCTLNLSLCLTEREDKTQMIEPFVRQKQIFLNIFFSGPGMSIDCPSKRGPELAG